MRRLIESQPAWLLHSRPFRDTSLLLDFLTLEHGRVSAIARGARGARSKTRALLQPFQPLSVSLAGTSELLNLRQVESQGMALSFVGERLFSALYVNELLVRLLVGHEGEASLFSLYGQTLQDLGGDRALEPLLRSFELRLLDLLGYGLQFSHEAQSQSPILAEAWYYLGEDSSFVRQLQIREAEPAAAQALFPGQELLRIADGDYRAESTRKAAKRLLRQALQQHMTERPLTSRQLFHRSGNTGD